MNIITHGHSLEDAVRQVLQLFFDINSDFEIVSDLKICGNNSTATTVIKFKDKTAREEITVRLDSLEKRQISDVIKKSVFFACKKISDMPTPWGISTGIRPAKTARMMLDKGALEDDVLKNLKDEYLISDEKASLCMKVAKKEKEILQKKLENGVSLYVGIPFCPTRCAYCSFISGAIEHNKKYVDKYVDALCLEIEETAQIAQKLGYKAETLYFGGGTPTTLSANKLDVLIKKVKEYFDISSLSEFTVEAGRPDTFSDEMLSMLMENGVNRISINPQTMNQKTLDKIGRFHTVEQTRKAFEMAKNYNCFSINADIIAGLPDETTKEFEKTVREVCELSPQAVTVHTMYLKRAARLISDFEKLRFASEVDAGVRFAHNYLENMGFAPYYLYKQKNTLGNLENVGFSHKGHESLYNIYIMEEVQTVLAMGGGASTKIVSGDRIERIFNPKDAADYIARIDEIIEKKQAVLSILCPRR